MEPAYFSACAALAGSLIGGLTSLTASWLTQHVPCQAQQRASDLRQRSALSKAFIEEAARWHADACAHDTADVANLVNLYALASRMRVLSSPQVVASADHVIRVIIETYLAPSKTFHDVRDIVENEAMHPLRALSNACREALQRRGAP